MAENPRIFLSHSSKDKELAEELANQIRAFLGFPQEAVFVSSEPEGIDAGADWFLSVSNALENSKALIVLVTSESMKSNWVWFEIGVFWNKNRDAIIPVHVPSVEVRHPLSTRQSKSLADEREIKVVFTKLDSIFGTGNQSTVDTSRVIELATKSSIDTIEIIEIPNIFGRN